MNVDHPIYRLRQCLEHGWTMAYLTISLLMGIQALSSFSHYVCLYERSQKVGLLGPRTGTFSFWTDDAQLHCQKILPFAPHLQWWKHLFSQNFRRARFLLSSILQEVGVEGDLPLLVFPSKWSRLKIFIHVCWSFCRPCELPVYSILALLLAFSFSYQLSTCCSYWKY